MTPLIGVTSEKSRPYATVTCSSVGMRSLVGSKSTQPRSGTKTLNQACEASAPISLGRPGGGLGEQVAAHVAGRQAQRAQRAHGQVGEVLTDAAAPPQHLGERRRHLGRFRVVDEVGVDAADQRTHGLEHGTAG